MSPRFGRPVSTGGNYPYVAFAPAPLPATMDLDLPTIRVLSEADSAVGRLAGAGRLLPNPYLLAAQYMTTEALASSRIEGTQASLSDVFDAAASGTPAPRTSKRSATTSQRSSTGYSASKLCR